MPVGREGEVGELERAWEAAAGGTPQVVLVLLEQLAVKQPLMLVIEDLHWAPTTWTQP